VNYCKHCGIHADEDECPKCGEWIAEERGPNPEREHGESMNDHPK
jgi:rRNA maturation protein Nop10